MKCKRTSDGRRLDHVTLQAIRLQALKAIREGLDVASVAAEIAVDRAINVLAVWPCWRGVRLSRASHDAICTA